MSEFQRFPRVFRRIKFFTFTRLAAACTPAKTRWGRAFLATLIAWKIYDKFS